MPESLWGNISIIRQAVYLVGEFVKGLDRLVGIRILGKFLLEFLQQLFQFLADFLIRDQRNGIRQILKGGVIRGLFLRLLLEEAFFLFIFA